MSEIEKTIRQYLNSSAGNCNHVTDRTILCFIGMIETGEATLGLFRSIGGRWLSERIEEHAKKIGSNV